MDIRVGDRLKLKKQHPCGSFTWLTLRTGMDFRIRCEGCSHGEEEINPHISS